jgi:hypothetical protein
VIVEWESSKGHIPVRQSNIQDAGKKKQDRKLETTSTTTTMLRPQDPTDTTQKKTTLAGNEPNNWRERCNDYVLSNGVSETMSAVYPYRQHTKRQSMSWLRTRRTSHSSFGGFLCCFPISLALGRGHKHRSGYEQWGRPTVSRVFIISSLEGCRALGAVCIAVIKSTN